MQSRKYWAFLVGINEYSDYARLRYCVDDVRGLEALLNSLGYVPVCLHDRLDPRHRRYPSKNNILAELEMLLEKVSKGDYNAPYKSDRGIR